MKPLPPIVRQFPEDQLVHTDAPRTVAGTPACDGAAHHGRRQEQGTVHSGILEFNIQGSGAIVELDVVELCLTSDVCAEQPDNPHAVRTVDLSAAQMQVPSRQPVGEHASTCGVVPNVGSSAIHGTVDSGANKSHRASVAVRCECRAGQDHPAADLNAVCVYRWAGRIADDGLELASDRCVDQADRS